MKRPQTDSVARAFAGSWNLLDPAVLEPILHDDIIYTDSCSGLISGKSAVMDHLSSQMNLVNQAGASERIKAQIAYTRMIYEFEDLTEGESDVSVLMNQGDEWELKFVVAFGVKDSKADLIVVHASAPKRMYITHTGVYPGLKRDHYARYLTDGHRNSMKEHMHLIYAGLFSAIKPTICIEGDLGGAPFACMSGKRWFKPAGPHYIGNTDGFDESIGASKELMASFVEWALKFAREYDKPTFRWIDWNRRGIQLTRTLKKELGSRYFYEYRIPVEDPNCPHLDYNSPSENAVDRMQWKLSRTLTHTTRLNRLKWSPCFNRDRCIGI